MNFGTGALIADKPTRDRPHTPLAAGHRKTKHRNNETKKPLLSAKAYIRTFDRGYLEAR